MRAITNPVNSNRVAARAIVLLAALAVALACGCGRRGNAPELHPVRGQIVAPGGQPAVGANLAFHQLGQTASASPVAQATTERDGSFALTTYEVGDGALAGDYAVTVVWPALTVEGDFSGPDRLRGRFGNPQTTPFRVSVKPGENNLQPFRLK